MKKKTWYNKDIKDDKKEVELKGSVYDANVDEFDDVPDKPNGISNIAKNVSRYIFKKGADVA